MPAGGGGGAAAADGAGDAWPTIGGHRMALFDPSRVGAARFDAYKSRPDFVAAPRADGEQAGRVSYYDFTKGFTKEQLAAIEKDMDEAAEKEEAAVAAMYAEAEAMSWRRDRAPDVALYHGRGMPVLGLATQRMPRLRQCAQSVRAALKAGVRRIDTAASAGNESAVGEALAASFSEDRFGAVRLTRDEVFVSGALPHEHATPDAVERACRDTLSKLRLRRLDLYLLEWPCRTPAQTAAVWKAMEALVEEGLVRAIGVSNFSAAKLEALLAEATVRPAVCQVEGHPYFRNDAMLNVCASNSVHVVFTNATGGVPPPKSMALPPSDPPCLLLDETVVSIAEKRGVQPEQVLLRWALQRGASTLIPAESVADIATAFDVFAWNLNKSELDRLSALEHQRRHNAGRQLLGSVFPSYEDLWDEPPLDTFASPIPDLKIPTFPLGRTGVAIPQIGLGTWKSNPGEVRKAVEHALRSGYRHIDCAEVYRNEGEVGDAIAAVLSEGRLKRDDVFVTGKLWNSDHAASRVEPAVRKSLSALKLDHLDLYLMHWPVTGNRGPTLAPSIAETWRAMEALVEKGLVRAIGVCNFSVKKLEALVAAASIPVSVCQIEGHPYFRNEKVIAWCQERGIHVTCYSPFGSPDSAAMMRRESKKLLEEPAVHAIAKRIGRDVGQVLVRWAIQRGVSTLPKSTSEKRIVSNLDVYSFELNAADVATLSSLEYQCRMVDPPEWITPQGPYRSYADLWDEEPIPTGPPIPDLKIPTFPLGRTGVAIPQIGLGTWKSNPGEVRKAVEHALRSGYRHIDCAEVYRNEGEVGDAIAAVLSEGRLKRDDVFVTGKLWNSDHAASRVEPAVRKSLSALKLDHLDLYLMHWPVTGNRGPTLAPSIAETWRAMEALVEKGLVRAIGVCNFSVKKLEALVAAASIPVSVCQIEGHPYFRNEKVIAWCQERGIHVTCYSPFGSPDSAAMMRRESKKLLEEPAVHAIAKRIGRDVGQVLVRWAIQRGVSTLPKSTSEKRIVSNLDVYSFELNAADVATLSSLEYQCRMVDPPEWITPQGPYRSYDELWDEPRP